MSQLFALLPFDLRLHLPITTSRSSSLPTFASCLALRARLSHLPVLSVLVNFVFHGAAPSCGRSGTLVPSIPAHPLRTLGLPSICSHLGSFSCPVPVRSQPPLPSPAGLLPVRGHSSKPHKRRLFSSVPQNVFSTLPRFTPALQRPTGCPVRGPVSITL